MPITERANSSKPKHSYKVFVSSTYLDNKERRKNVQDAITMAGMVWQGMEIFAASRSPTVEECLRFAREADILVHEAYVDGNSDSDGDILRSWSIYDYHSSAREAGEAAEKANVKILVLTHLIPVNAPEGYFLEEAGKAFRGKIIVGRDLMRIPVPNDDIQKTLQ